jgi:transposase
VKDLPVGGIPLTLRLQVRRFFCDNSECARKTFVEGVPELALPFARKTVRLTEQLRQLGFAMGAEQGARSATALEMACSADTFLRLLRKTALDSHATPTHLGVDDWAFRRNVSYGTMLVDLQDHQVVDLLPDRSATALENWLKAHPGVQLISRDRAGEYATGARKGAPEAVQVADRFHIQVRRIGACLDSFQRKEGLRAKTPKTVADLTGKPKQDRSMRQRQTCPKAFTARSACLARHGEATLPNLARPSAVRNARRCTERLLRRCRAYTAVQEGCEIHWG